MRRTLFAALTAAMLLSLAAPALAHPEAPVGPTLPTDLTHASTDNVDYLGRFPEHWGSAGGRPHGDHYYLTDPRGVFIFDITEPESPELVGQLDLFQQTLGAALAQEDPDTDGNILLVDGSPQPVGTAELQVVDVSDPTDPSIIGSVDVTDHTWTCVSATDGDELNECAYAYGRTGHIVDLTTPSQPVLLDHTWRERVNYGGSGNSPYAHDLTEFRPGLVMSAGADAILMDTTDPAEPIRLASIDQADRWSKFGYHSVEWANGGTDPYVVLGTELAPPGRTEAAGSDCDSEQSVIETWDARDVVAALEVWEDGEKTPTRAEEVFTDVEFTRIDTFDAAGRGIFLQGGAPAHVLYCAHWMDLHPDFDAGGLMAVAYYDRGTRFVEVADDGTMSEVGWMVPAEGYAGAPRWVSDDVVYVSDYRRGMEVLRLTPEEATGVEQQRSTGLAVGSSIVPTSALDLGQSSTVALGLFGFLMLAAELRRRRRISSID